MPRGPRRAGTTGTAAFLIFAVTAFFLALGIQLVREAVDPSAIDRETYLAGMALGLNENASRNFSGILAVVVLLLCALTTFLGFGTISRREGTRHATIGTFILFALIMIPLAISGLTSEDSGRGPWIGMAIGAADAIIVWMMLSPATVADFERAEKARRLARQARAEKRAARHARLPGAA